MPLIHRAFLVDDEVLAQIIRRLAFFEFKGARINYD